MSSFFDLSFVVLCLVLAVRADRSAFFAVGMTPPLLMLGAFTAIALASPGALARPEDGAVQALVSGMLLHAPGLAAGYALCLLTLGARVVEERDGYTILADPGGLVFCVVPVQTGSAFDGHSTTWS